MDKFAQLITVKKKEEKKKELFGFCNFYLKCDQVQSVILGQIQTHSKKNLLLKSGESLLNIVQNFK